MASERTTWTVLPQGADGRRLRLVVMPSPRLEPDGETGKLSQFATWADWPATLASLSFSLQIGDGVPLAATPAAEAEASDPKLWGRLFGGDLDVQGFAKPEPPAIVRSYPTLAMRDVVRNLIVEVAKTTVDRPPRIEALQTEAFESLVELARVDDHPEPLAAGLNEALQLRHTRMLKIGAELTPATAPELELPKDLSVNAAAFLRARDFLQTRIPGRGEDQPKPPPVEPPKFDFHQAVSLLSGHPTLLRRLGLAIELELEAPDEVPASGRIRVVADGLPQEAVCPWTAFEHAGDRFVVAPKDDGTVRDGMLTLDDEGTFQVERVDMDGAAVKLIETVDQLRKRPAVTRLLGLGLDRVDAGTGEPATVEEPAADAADEEAPMPGLRSAGFSFVRDKRDVDVAQRVSRAIDLDGLLNRGSPDEDVALDADDLVRGYRLDVWDADSKSWRSLHRRRVTYRLEGGDPILVEEEGYIKSAATRTKGEDDKRELFVHEVLFGWDGWSLSAPRPGRVIGAPGEPERAGEPGTPEPLEIPKNEAIAGFGLVTEMAAAPGTLPRLRYGETYRFRARAVDLAAGGLDLDSADEAHATAEHRYLRYEPVAAPSVVRRWLDTEGESLDRVVVRSDVGADPARYAAREQVRKALAGRRHTYRATSDRHLAAPKVSQWMAELHGMFDGALGPSGDPSDYWKLAIREAATLLDRGVNQEGEPVEADDVVKSEAKGKQPDARLPAASRLEPGQYFVREGDSIELPYLPDPLSRGVAISGLPGTDREEPLVVKWEGKWPDLAPLRLELDGGDGAPEVDGRRIVVHLPPGEVAVLQIASLLDDDGRALMAIDELTGRSTTPDWMLTPPRELRLVHAVQRPLAPPSFKSLELAARAPGDTHVDLIGALAVDAKSTGRVELVGTWTDPIDVPGTPEVEHDSISAVPAAYDLARTEDEIAIEPPQLPALDLLARMSSDEIAEVLRDRPPAAQRFVAHHFAALDTIAPALKKIGMEPAMIELGRADAESLQMRPVPAAQLTELRTHREARHDFSDTKHRVVKYVPRGTTRYREYFPPAIARDPAQITSPPLEDFAKPDVGVEVNVLSSARPLAPVVRAVLPSFRWETTTDTDRTTSRTRHGGSVRVLLERPWYSSGDGEQLAIVLAPTQGEPFGGVKFSAWGSDPVWRGAGGPAQPLAADHFPRAVDPRDGLALAESPESPPVAVAPHAVTLDAERGVWVCEVDFAVAEAYFPFARLTLARYQPDSIDGLHLSPVVVSEFVQVLPSRSATATRGDGVAEVELRGASAENVLADEGVVVQAMVQHQPTDLSGDIGWVTASAVRLDASGGVGDRTWSGRVELGSKPQGQRRRLLVTEHEWFPSDSDVGERSIDGIWAASRLVYADSFDV